MRIDLAGRDPSREHLKWDLAREDLPAELAVPAFVALGAQALEGRSPDHGAGDEQRLGQRVDAADVRMEQVRAVHALAAQLRVEIEAAGREPSGPDDLVHGKRQLLDRVGELVRVPAVLV